MAEWKFAFYIQCMLLLLPRLKYLSEIIFDIKFFSLKIGHINVKNDITLVVLCDARDFLMNDDGIMTDGQ